MTAQFPDEQQDGAFERQESHFRSEVRRDPDHRHPAAADRYHLYVSLACPWAHRTIIVRTLLGLEETVSLSVVDPVRDENGWAFREGRGHGADPINGFSYLSEAYLASDPDFSGRVTVPVLWDKELSRVVNNESAEIVRMLGPAFSEFTKNDLDLYPSAHRSQIDSINQRVYDEINNGVYKTGFATAQAVYEREVETLFAALDWLEDLLDGRSYLVGDALTEADVRLYTTLVRFDAVYAGHFKCNLRRIADYPNLSAYLRRLYHQPAFGESTDFDHIKRHYYMTHPSINPNRIVPAGPVLDFVD